MNLSAAYSHIPGKSGKDGAHLPLWMHLEDTAYTMEYLCLHRVPASIRNACELEADEFRKAAVFLAMVHDLGKCTPLFSARILASLPEEREGLERSGLTIPPVDRFLHKDSSPHAFAGEVLLSARDYPNGVCSVVGSHHGKPTSEVAAAQKSQQLSAYKQNYYAGNKAAWEAAQDELIRRALERAGYAAPEELPVLSNCAQMLLTGLLIQADWIASNEEYYPLLPAGVTGHEKEYPARAEAAMEKLNLPDCWLPPLFEAAPEEFYRERFGFAPNPMQVCVAEAARSMHSGGLMIIEAQMGIGKTEAALAAAEILGAGSGVGGVFFGLPTQATSNGIFPRMAGWAEKRSEDQIHSIRLVHGMAELNEDYQQYFRGQAETDGDGTGGLAAHSWFSGRKQSLLADFVVGTVDTALMSALKQKHVMLRHTGLCSKAVIIDECHAYDAYMSKYLDQMLRWFGAYRIPVILLSATLPEQRRLKMLQAYLGQKSPPEKSAGGYPLITWTEGEKIRADSVSEAFTSHQVGINRLEEDALISDLAVRLSDGGCAGIIVNTVKRAQSLFERLRETFPGKKVFVYHAQFLAEDRVRRENELMDMIGKHSTPETRNNVIVIGTQVLEQSLDIDFDYLITDLCPMDLLLQRIGRLHRHERRRPDRLALPVCSVMNAGEELEKGAEAIYHRWPLKQTVRCLPETILIPKDIPRLVNLVYADPEPGTDDSDWLHFRDLTDIKEEKASAFLLGKPKKSRIPAMNSISGMLDMAVEGDARAEAAVRDGSPSVDVLVMRRLKDGKIGFLPWVSDAELRADSVPAHEEGKAVARQRLRLPGVFCRYKHLGETVDALEQENDRLLSPWQESPWLKGELVFLLDENAEREFGGYHVRYEKELGLIYERSEST